MQANKPVPRENPRFIERVPTCKVCDDRPDSIPDTLEDAQSGDVICNKCGLVIEAIIDQRSEWRNFSSDLGKDDPGRVGGPEDPTEVSGMTIQIGKDDGGAGTGRDIRRAHMKQDILVGSEKVMADAQRCITDFCERGKLAANVAKKAKLILKEVEKHLHQKDMEPIVATTIYLSCKHFGVTRTIKEISSLTGVTKKDIGKYVSKFTPIIGSIGVVNESDLVPRFCDKLGLEFQVQNTVTQVVKKIKDVGVIAGKTPNTLIAAAIYLVSQANDLGVSQKHISNTLGIAEGTLKNAYKELLEEKAKIVLPELGLKKGPNEIS